MTTLNDAILATTGGPTINEGLSDWFSRTIDESLQDAERRWLGEQGPYVGQRNDSWYAFLGDLGHIGALNDRLLSYWATGGLGFIVVLPPANIAATGFFDPPGRIDLSWQDNVANDNVAVSYTILRDGQPDVEIAAPTLVFSDTRDLDADIQYTHRIRINNADGAGNPSAPINTAIPNLILWSPPTAVTAGAVWVNGNTIQIAWVAPVLVAGSFPIASYNVYQNGILVGNTTDLFLNVTATLGLTSGWTVLVVDTNGNQCEANAPVLHEFLPRGLNLHWDETGHVGAVPVTGWIDNIQALDLVAAGAGDIEVRQQNGVDMLEVINFPASMQPALAPLITGDLSVILAGFMPPNQLSGNESLLDGTATSVPTRLLIYTTAIGDIIVGQLGALISGSNADHAGQNLFTIVSDDLGANQTTTYLDTVLQRVTASTGQFLALTLFGDNNQVGNARPGAWVAEILVFDFAIDASERAYWEAQLSAKWGI